MLLALEHQPPLQNTVFCCAGTDIVLALVLVESYMKVREHIEEMQTEHEIVYDIGLTIYYGAIGTLSSWYNPLSAYAHGTACPVLTRRMVLGPTADASLRCSRIAARERVSGKCCDLPTRCFAKPSSHALPGCFQLGRAVRAGGT